MKAFILAFLLMVSAQANALEVRVIGPKAAVLFEVHTKAKAPTHVGDVSLDVFERFEIPFQGGSCGFSKIFDFGNDLKVVSDTEMKAYGWCFSVDGVTPETMADQTPINGQENVIEWYYAYAHYKDGDWIGQCVRD